MKQLNNFIQEKLKIKSDTKINDDKINTLEDFGAKYGCSISKDSTNNFYEYNILNINNKELKNKIKSFFKYNHEQYLDLYFKVQDYVEKINELDDSYRTSIKRDSDKGYIEIECKNLMTDVKYGYIKLFKKDNIISQGLNKKDKNKEKINKMLVQILDFIINENN